MARAIPKAAAACRGHGRDQCCQDSASRLTISLKLHNSSPGRRRSAVEGSCAFPAGMIQPAPMPAAPALRRALGRWDLTAIGVNQVIGGAIFLWPAQVAAQVGAWSPIGFVLIGLLSLSVALCFAELSSRFDATGGPYLYTRAAFGDFVGFQVGWMQWFSRASSPASIRAATAVALGYYWPALTVGWPRDAFLVALTVLFAWINVRGVRQGSWVVNVLTIGKLVPLAIFIIIGLAYVEPSRLTTLPPITIRQALAAGLLLVFIYGGYE